jgi:hypothetical protein
MPPLVASPLFLPVGWTESPPFFCTFTETVCDMANDGLRRNIRTPSHYLEHMASTGDYAPNPDRGRDTLPVRRIPFSH